MECSAVSPVCLGAVIFLWLHAEQTMHDSYFLNHPLLCVWLPLLSSLKSLIFAQQWKHKQRFRYKYMFSCEKRGFIHFKCRCASITSLFGHLVKEQQLCNDPISPPADVKMCFSQAVVLVACGHPTMKATLGCKAKRVNGFSCMFSCPGASAPSQGLLLDSWGRLQQEKTLCVCV